MIETQIPEDGPVLVEADADSRLAQLHAEYADAKAAADEAAARLKTITDGIKAELSALAPDETRVELRGAGRQSLRLTYTESWRLDSRALKKADPHTYVKYAKKSGSWSLRPVGGGE